MTADIKHQLDHILTGDLGESGYALYDEVKNITNGTIVELGSYIGESARVLLINAESNNNQIYGVDVSFDSLSSEVLNDPRYNTILGDSSTIGKYWESEVDLLFIDTFHIRQQVMSELHYWYPKVKQGGVIVFHDTNWPEDKRDVYGGIAWPRVEEAIFDFFGIAKLNYEDDYIEVKNYPERWGLTTVRIKIKKDYVSQFEGWEEVFRGRNELIQLFWNDQNKGEVVVDLIHTK